MSLGMPASSLSFRYTSLNASVEQPGSLMERRGGSIECHVIEGGSVSCEVRQSSTYHALIELAREWPEVVAISLKLTRREKLDKRDELWVKGLAEASGWSVNAIIEELLNLDIDPSERTERYKELFEEYYREALEYMKKGNTRQAGEKIWGAAVALIKLYASIKGVFIPHWSRGKLDSFITNNVEQEYRKLFRDLLDKAHRLHEHFYEGDLDKKTFEERWTEVVEYLEKAKKIVLKHLKQHTVEHRSSI